MTTLADAVAQIVGNEAPVLCVDACVVLDFYRAPARDFAAGHLEAAVFLLERAEEQEKGLNLILMGQVTAEIARHAEAIRLEGQRALEKHDQNAGRIAKLLAAAGLEEVVTENFGDAGYGPAIDHVIARYRNASIILDDDAYEGAAVRRMRDARPPASRGANSLADCIIVEAFLELALELRTQAFSGDILFLTTNTADFADDTKRLLRPGLAEDFSAVGALNAFALLPARYALFPA